MKPKYEVITNFDSGKNGIAPSGPIYDLAVTSNSRRQIQVKLNARGWYKRNKSRKLESSRKRRNALRNSIRRDI